MSRQYKNPPIKEAVCEFRFQSERPWDLADPGLIYSELKDDFPKRVPNPVTSPGVVISVGRAELQSQVDERIGQDISQLQGLRFWREGAEDGLIVVRSNRLGISHYRPYPSWEGFLPTIQQAFGAYVKVAEPTGIQRIGLRYVNDIVFELGTVDLEDYFEYYPHLGSNLPQDFGAFHMTLNFPYNQSQDVLRLQLATVPATTDEQVIIRLDLDYSVVGAGAVLLDHTTEWLQRAHDSLEEVFEGCLKDSARAMFDQAGP